MMRRPSKVRLLFGLLLYLVACAAVVVLLVATPDGQDRLVRFVLAAAAFVASLVFMTAYHFGTRGSWRTSDIGVNLMFFGLANAIVMGLVVAAGFGWIPVVWLPYFSALTYLTVAWLEIWRTTIMLGYLRKGSNDRADRA